MTFNAKETGQRIRTRRNELQMSSIQVALDLSISLDYLRKLELGHRSPSIDLLMSISEYFNVSTDYLLTGLENSADIHREINTVMKKLSELHEKI